MHLRTFLMAELTTQLSLLNPHVATTLQERMTPGIPLCHNYQLHTEIHTCAYTHACIYTFFTVYRSDGHRLYSN